MLVKAWDLLEKIMRAILIDRLHINWFESNWAAFLQFVKFGLVGVTNTVISYVLNIIVLLVLQPYDVSWDFVAANTVAFVLSVLWSYVLNSKFVFEKDENKGRSILKSLIKVYLSYAFTGIVLANVLSYIWINIFGISKYIAPLINLIISVPVNFFLNKLWAFKD